MDFWLKINLTMLIIWLLIGVLTSKHHGINNKVDVIAVMFGLFVVISWPLYLLALIWQ